MKCYKCITNNKISHKKYLSQVFLKSEEFVKKLVAGTSITKDDVVIEIGPGKGIITNQLIKKAKNVIAIEKDPYLTQLLQERYNNVSNVKIIQADILRYPLPSFPYKVFSNIPFSIEGELIRIFLNVQSGLIDGYLFMRREYARRFAGIPHESRFHIIYSPWFDLEIFCSLRRDDFRPKPRVETDILRFRKKEESLIDVKHRYLYEMFVKQGYGGGPMLKRSLIPAPFSKIQLIQLAQSLGFKITDKPSKLSLKQWIDMFKFFLTIPETQQQKFIAKIRN